MPAKEQVWEHLVSNSAVTGGLERYFIPAEEAPQEQATVIRLVLTTRVPKIAFEDSCLQFANSIIEAGGGVYREKILQTISTISLSLHQHRKNGRYIKKTIGRLDGLSRQK